MVRRAQGRFVVLIGMVDGDSYSNRIFLRPLLAVSGRSYGWIFEFLDGRFRPVADIVNASARTLINIGRLE